MVASVDPALNFVAALNLHGSMQTPRTDETERPRSVRWCSVRSFMLQFETRVHSLALESAYGSGHITGLPGLA